jgi:hypothetical protein
VNKPFEVGDVVVFNPEHVESVSYMQAAGSLIGDVVFDPDATMIVQSIEPYESGLSGWIVTTSLHGNPDAGTMRAWDSDWFIRFAKEKEKVDD